MYTWQLQPVKAAKLNGIWVTYELLIVHFWLPFSLLFLTLFNHFNLYYLSLTLNILKIAYAFTGIFLEK